MNEIFEPVPGGLVYNKIKDMDEPMLVENREINVTQGENFVVHRDSRSQLISFMVNRYFDNVDLSDKTISIKYKNENQECDRSPAVNTERNDTHLKFCWLLDAKATKVSGQIQFAVEFIGKDEKGDFYSWNTKTAYLAVEETLHVDGEIEEPEPTWIQQWSIQANEITREVNNAITYIDGKVVEVGQKATDGIAAIKTQQTTSVNAVNSAGVSYIDRMNQIAADVQENFDQKTDVYQTEALAIKPTATSELIHVTDSAEWRPQVITLDGKSEQVATEDSPSPQYPAAINSPDKYKLLIDRGVDRNYLLDTATSVSITGNGAANQATSGYRFPFGTLKNMDIKHSDFVTTVYEWEAIGSNFSGSFYAQFNATPFGVAGGLQNTKYSGTSSPNNQVVNISDSNNKGMVIISGTINENTINSWMVSEATNFRFRLDNVPSTVKITFKNAKLSKGDTFNRWSPAPEDIPGRTINITLDDLIKSLPDSTKDKLTLDFRDRIATVNRCIGRTVLQGTEDIIKYITTDDLGDTYGFRVLLQSQPHTNTTLTNFIRCTHFKQMPRKDIATNPVEGVYLGSNDLCAYFKVRKSLIADGSVAAFKKWLVGESVMIDYRLKYPTTEQIPWNPEWDKLRMYYGDTYVCTEPSAYLYLEYVADTKLYTDNKIKELAAAIVATEGGI